MTWFSAIELMINSWGVSQLSGVKNNFLASSEESLHVPVSVERITETSLVGLLFKTTLSETLLLESERISST